MKLSEHRFYKGAVTKRFTMNLAPGEHWDTPYTRYSYETLSAVYDVDVRDSDGDKTYHINGGFSTEKRPHHEAIETHYGI